jgi:hypothetical protein
MQPYSINAFVECYFGSVASAIETKLRPHLCAARPDRLRRDAPHQWRPVVSFGRTVRMEATKDFEHSAKVEALRVQLQAFMDEHIYPNEGRYQD